jgi:tetratricopeptide (TPR) repeat protein
MACALMLAFLSAPGAFGQERGLGQANDHNQRGLEYFKQGFYNHTPKNEKAEAERNYGLAIKEFREAIDQDPFFPTPRRNLARLYFLQKNFDGAVEQYQSLTELTPGDLDAYVNLALALIELNRYDQAIQTLERAKLQISDPSVLEKLDSYIARIRANLAGEVD